MKKLPEKAHPEQTRTKPELLAPAGSLESFHAAVEAGADAVYLGIDVLNARLRAKNFTTKTLSFLVPYARQKGVAVHVTLNTLVKQQELETAIHTLHQLQQIGVDAVIVQDLGLAHIACKHFPRLAVHASTQMAIHNSLGAHMAADLGMKRAILARELSLPQIELLAAKSPIELEVFAHGALCYCVSGLCLASSYLGGLSGNRGRCTQVCRRRYDSGNGNGFYFSPKDFCAVEFLPDYERLGIASLKIEGRMRSAEYVYDVVSGYRTALDDHSRIPDVRERLEHDLGREKTSFFLNNAKGNDIIVPNRPSGTGVRLGKILAVEGNTLQIESTTEITAGDRIRTHGSDGLEGSAARVLAVESKGTRRTITARFQNAPSRGDQAYLVSRASTSTSKWGKKRVDIHPARYSEKCPFAKKILGGYRRTGPSTKTPDNEQLFIRIDHLDWLYQLGGVQFDGVLLDVGLEGLRRFARDKKLNRSWAQICTVCLPAFIQEEDLPAWDNTVSLLRSLGISRWLCGHVSQRKLFTSRDILWSDKTVWCMNRASQAALRSFGYESFSYSPEDDVLNLKDCGSNKGLFTLFGHIDLFFSRIPSFLRDGTVLEDAKGEHFFSATKNGMSVMVGSRPLCLTHRRSMLCQVGISKWVMDLGYLTPNKRILRTLLKQYQQEKKLPDSTIFNHKAGLK